MRTGTLRHGVIVTLNALGGGDENLSKSILTYLAECRLGTGVNRKDRKICAHGSIPVATKSHAFGEASILKAIMKDLPGILCLICPFA